MAGRSSLNCEEGSFNGSRVSQLRAKEGLLARKEVCGLKYYEGECAIPHRAPGGPSIYEGAQKQVSDRFPKSSFGLVSDHFMGGFKRFRAAAP